MPPICTSAWPLEMFGGLSPRRISQPRHSPEYRKALQLAPDLAVEVASEYQYQPGLDEKARRYLRFGTRLVWVIWPRHQTVDIWHPGDTASTTLSLDDTLNGEDVVPGFRYPVASLFA